MLCDHHFQYLRYVIKDCKPFEDDLVSNKSNLLIRINICKITVAGDRVYLVQIISAVAGSNVAAK